MECLFLLFQGQDKDLLDARYRNNVNFDNLKDIESIFHYNTDEIKHAFYHIRILLNNTRSVGYS